MIRGVQQAHPHSSESGSSPDRLHFMILIPLFDVTTSNCEDDIHHSRKQDMAFYDKGRLGICKDMLIVKMIL
jgi:hypothetical protein